MKKFKLLFIVTLLVLLLPNALIYASTSTIDDKAELLTQDEFSQLQTKIDKICKENELSIVILTTKSIPTTPKTYLEDYYDAHYNKETFNNAVLLLCDMGSRRVEIQGYGNQELYVKSSRCEKIRETITPSLTSGNYYKAFSLMLDKVSDYQGNHPNPLMHSWCQLLIALVVGGIIVFSMVYQSKGKITTNSRTYLDNEHSGLTAQRDIYLHTTVTKVKHEKSDNSSSGGGVSSGGHSHSGSGGSF